MFLWLRKFVSVAAALLCPLLLIALFLSVFFLSPPVSLGMEMAHSGGTPVVPIERLRPLTNKSGYIFAGTVTAIHASPAHDAKDVATIAITFHVDHAVRGVRTGQSLTIREWMGVWENGQRYRVGEKVFLFLYQPSKLGLTSIVGGPQGRMSIHRGGQVNVGLVRYTRGVASGGPVKNFVSVAELEQAVRFAEKDLR